MPIKASKAVQIKLKNKHGVTLREVTECFLNREGGFVVDEREHHRTDPLTQMFIAETDAGRTLKICFMMIDGEVHIKTAYEPSRAAMEWYAERQ